MGLEVFPKSVSHKMLILSEHHTGHTLRTAGTGVTEARAAEVQGGRRRRDRSGTGKA